MFRLFGKKTPECPVDEETRIWIEQGMVWLCNEFGIVYVRNKRILVMSDEDFPVHYDGSTKSAYETLKIVADQMDINFDDILLHFYSEGIPGQRTGMLENGIEIDPEAHNDSSSGRYHGIFSDGKYHISLEEKNLHDPLRMVATLAHELAHVKLLGEYRMDENSEHYTELATIIFGVGIFNANTAFRLQREERHWQYQQLGYLTQIQWGYALAVYASLRAENGKTWTKYLNDTVLGNFKRGIDYIQHNREKLHFADFL